MWQFLFVLGEERPNPDQVMKYLEKISNLWWNTYNIDWNT